MPKYKDTSVIAKLGINYIRNIIEESGSIFHKIEQENDLGIDGLIEFIENGEPTSQNIAVQIKSGNSYYNESTQECIIPVGSHYDYWNNYPLPIYGIVYVHDLKKGFWVNIKDYFESKGKVSVIKFSINRTNIFDLKDFNRIFIPYNLNRIPLLSYEEATSFFLSTSQSEFHLGMVVLFRRYVNMKITWDLFLNYIKDNEVFDIPYSLIYYLAHIPWHPDISYHGEDINKEIKSYVISIIKAYDKDMVIKLLSLIDDDTICRGSIGQSVEAILSKVDNINTCLGDLILDEKTPKSIIEHAALIYAYYEGVNSLPILIQANQTKQLNLDELIQYIQSYDWINPYS